MLELKSYNPPPIFSSLPFGEASLKREIGLNIMVCKERQSPAQRQGFFIYIIEE